MVSWIRRSTIIVSALAAVVSACTFLTARDNGQCHTDADCRSKGGAFLSTRCSAVGTCELITLPDAGPDASTTCTTNAECNVRLGNKARCGAGICVQITNPSCTTVEGDPTNDDAIFVGVMSPQVGPNQAYGTNQFQTIQTAVQEWNRQAAGQQNAKPIVAVGCDELTDPQGTAAFLIGTVGAHAIYGPMYDDNFEVVAQLAANNGIYAFGPRADDVKLPTFPAMGQWAWSCMPNRNIQVQYFPALMNIIETQVKGGSPADIKVFFLVSNDVATTNFADAIENVMTFNGKSAVANGSNYVRASTPFTFKDTNNYAAVVAQMVAAAPKLVIVAQEYDLSDLANAIEQGWPTTGTPAFPRFLFLHADPSFQEKVNTLDADFRGRTDFVDWQTTANEQTNLTVFKSAFRSATQVEALPLSERAYDCFYESAYALQHGINKTGSVGTVDFTTFAQGIHLLNAPGTPVNVGVSSIGNMLTILSANGDPDLDGASSGLEYGTNGFSPIQDATLNCIKADKTIAPAGVTFSATTGAASGSYSCL